MLKLNGKPFSLVQESARAVAIRKVLDKAPTDEIFTADELEAKHGLRDVRDSYRFVPGYSHKVGVRRFWGNPKAIKTLIEQVSQ